MAMWKNDAISLLKSWFERDLGGRYANWERDVELVSLGEDGTVRIRIYTDTHRFAIVAKPGLDRPAEQPGCGSTTPETSLPSTDGVQYSYLGCTATTRKPRAGEEHCRGNDLADGPLNEDTWLRILGDIISFGLVKIHRDARMKVGPRGARPPAHPMPVAPGDD